MRPPVVVAPTLALALFSAVLIAQPRGTTRNGLPRPKGPCDIYAAADDPCVAAHSTTRALLESYNGPLYQVKRESDGKLMDIGVVADGFADANKQDAFCAHSLCVINLIYDQSGKENHLYQAPPGPNFPGPAKGGFDTQPIADMAPITIGGHKAYGVYIMPGMGFRNNNAVGIAINDEPEGIYYVVDGSHYDSGCCFDYGNSSTNGRAVGTGTMETTYFGTSTVWGSGAGPGPWIMSDMEGGLFSGYNAKENGADPTIESRRFVTAIVDGGGGNKWDLRGGNGQKGPLTTFYSGIRPGSQTNSSYYPMHKQGGILLGTGGDNGNGSSGTFYEGAITVGYPTEATTDAVQSNIVAARYDTQTVALSRVSIFTPRSTQDVSVTFTNTTNSPVTGVKFSLSLPAGWAPVGAKIIEGPVAPGATVATTFKVTSPAATSAGFIAAKVEWPGASDTMLARVRNAEPVKINEVRFSNGGNATDQFIELFNAASTPVDLSNWKLTHTPSQWATFKLATIPSGTRIAAHSFYLLGLANSGLAAPVSAGATSINVRSTASFEPGQKIEIDGERRTVVSVGTSAGPMTMVFEPVSTGPWITIPAGSTNLPIASVAGFAIGQKVAIDLGGNYELATVTAVGKAGTQTMLSVGAAAGAAEIKLAATANITAGDTLTIGTGTRKELVKVVGVGDTVNLATPLKFAHAASIDVSDAGTGITFFPATKLPHASGDAVQALGSGITLDQPLAKPHPDNAPVLNSSATTGGYTGPSPNQWFGGVLAARGGSIALMDASGMVVVDAIVYGSQQSNSSGNGTVTSPELATLESAQDKGGCIAVVPTQPRAFGAASPPVDPTNRSLGRFPDSADTGNNCTDFHLQPVTTLLGGTKAGETNIKVATVTGFLAGQGITIDTGVNRETVVIATVGTAGATTTSASVDIGATSIPVAAAIGFTAGQIINIDIGTNAETATIASVAGGRGGARVIVVTPLTRAHASGVKVSGSGITLAESLTKPHGNGAPVATDFPTPGAPNLYRKPR